MNTGHAIQLALRDRNVEHLVAQGERYGTLYDAYGRTEDLELAVAYEKAAFELRNDHSNPVPSAA